MKRTSPSGHSDSRQSKRSRHQSPELASLTDTAVLPESEGTEEPTQREHLCVVTFADDDQDFLEQSRVVPQDTPAERIHKLEWSWGMKHSSLDLSAPCNTQTLSLAVRLWFEHSPDRDGIWLWLPADYVLLDDLHAMYVKARDEHSPRTDVRRSMAKLFKGTNTFEYLFVASPGMRDCWNIRRYLHHKAPPDILDPACIVQYEYPFTELTRKATSLHIPPHFVIYNAGTKLERLIGSTIGSVEDYASFFHVNAIVGAALKLTHEIFQAWMSAQPSAEFMEGGDVSSELGLERDIATQKHARWLREMEDMGDGIGSVHSKDISPWRSLSMRTPRCRTRPDGYVSREESDHEDEPNEEEDRLHARAMRRVSKWRKEVWHQADEVDDQQKVLTDITTPVGS